MAYESDIMITMMYLAVVSTVFVLLLLAERAGVSINKSDSPAPLDKFIESARSSRIIEGLAWRVVYYGVSFFLVAGALVATRITMDFSIFALGLFVVTMLLLFVGRVWLVGFRILSYISVVFVVYLSSIYQPEFLAGADFITYLFFGMLVAGIVLTIRFTDRGGFVITPTDFLVILAVITLAISSGSGILGYGVTAVVLKSIILFYGCELILNRVVRRYNIFMLSILVSLLIVGVRGFY
jgi:UDP-GlcNAc:undecaprenyl-phosphate GlcNAc-1-phosphate transferase